jgi:polygalacturonase
MDVSRRSFLGGALALSAAVALPGAAFAAAPTIYGDGIHDDTAGLQAALDGKAFRCVGEAVVRNAGGSIYISGGSYLLSHTLLVRKDATIYGGHFHASDELTGPVLHMSGGTMINCHVHN